MIRTPSRWVSVALRTRHTLSSHRAGLHDRVSRLRFAPAMRPRGCATHRHEQRGLARQRDNAEGTLPDRPTRRKPPIRATVDNGSGYSFGVGRSTSVASADRCTAAEPYANESLFARFRYRWIGYSQVKPIPPCNCTHSSADRTATGRRTRARRRRRWEVAGRRPTVGRIAGDRAGLGRVHPHIGDAVLQRLVRADQAAELVALLHVVDGSIQAPGGDAELLGGEQREAGEQPASTAAAAAARSPPACRWRHRTSCRRADGSDPARRPAPGHTVGGSRPRTPVGGGDEQHVGDQRVGDAGDSAGQPVTVRGHREAPLVRAENGTANAAVTVGEPAAVAVRRLHSASSAVVATIALPRNGTGATARPSSSARRRLPRAGTGATETTPG